MIEHEKLKALMDKLGLSYADLATHLGLTYNSTKSMIAPFRNNN